MKQEIKSANGTPKAKSNRQPIRVEPSRRWVRVEFNGQIVADSKRPILAWPEGHMVTYYFPMDDVRRELLTEARQGSDGKQYYDLRVDDQVAEAAAWSYPDPEPDKAALEGYFTFKWNKMDHWYEEEEEIFGHPRDPYHRVDPVQSSRHIEVVVDGVTVAETQRPVLLFETGLPTRYYFPQEDVRMDLLTPTRAVTYCPYKGVASYWTVAAGDETRRNIVWGYLDPLPEMPKIKGLLSFFNEKVDIYVDGELEERPQTPWG